MTFDELDGTLRARSDAVVGAGVGQAAVSGAERALGVSFPPALREYLLRFGHLELGHFELFGLGHDLPDYLHIVKMTLSERTDTEYPVRDDLIPLLNDGGGNLYCIATREDEAGTIVFWDHAGGNGQEADPHASSFTEWVVELLEDLDDE